MSAVPAISPARKAAFGILLAVERGNAHSHSHSDDLLRGKEVSALAPCGPQSCYGLGAWRSALADSAGRAIERLSQATGGKLDREVRIALRLGAFQLLFLDRIPAHAAIDESVELAKQSGHRFAAGMVNAVLAKVGLRRRSAL